MMEALIVLSLKLIITPVTQLEPTEAWGLQEVEVGFWASYEKRVFLISKNQPFHSGKQFGSFSKS
jgi:hypothetical protein